MNVIKKVLDRKGDIQILDPFSTICKLAILKFDEKGTKLTFVSGTLNLQAKSAWQGIVRFTRGDRGEDIHNLHYPIYWACKWYIDHFESINLIFSYAKDGLIKLSHEYEDDQMIHHCLSFYINMISSCLQKDNLAYSDVADDEIQQLYLPYKDSWTREEQEIVGKLFQYISHTSNPDVVKRTIETFLEVKS